MKGGTKHTGLSEGACTEMLKIHREFLASGKFCHLFLSQSHMPSESLWKTKIIIHALHCLLKIKTFFLTSPFNLTYFST